MSPSPKLSIARWLIAASSIAVSCSLQMPGEDEVFSNSGGRTGSGGKPSGGAGEDGFGGTSEGGNTNGGALVTGGRPPNGDGGSTPGEAGAGGEWGGAAGMPGSGQGGKATGGVGEAGSPTIGGAGEGGEASGGASGGAPAGGRGGTISGGAAGRGGAGGGAGGRGGAGGGGAGGSGGGTTFNPEQGLVAHYTFDETSGIVAANRIDSTKNGTYFGSVGHPTGRFGRAFSVRNATGSVDWVELPEGLLSTLSATTIIIWIRDLSTDRKGGRLFDFGSGSPENLYFSPDQVNPSTSLAGGHLGGTHLSLGFVDLWTSAANLTDKTWHQVAITWNSESIDLYIDSVHAGSKVSPTAIPSDLGATTPNWLGRSFNDVYPLLYAEGDDLRIYDKVLTAAEIALMFGLP
jgi:hypothetical protein